MFNGFSSLTRRKQSYKIAFENEYSNFYDYMLYGSAEAMESALKKVEDWRGALAVAIAYDLGLTGLRHDPDKAGFYYAKTKSLIVASSDRADRLTGQELIYTRSLDFENLLHPASDKEQRVRRVVASFIATSRGADCGLLDVEYIRGIAYSYRLANLVRAIPADKEDKALKVLINNSLSLLELYSYQNMASMKILLERAETTADSFLLFLLGMIFWDAYRNPLSVTDIRMNLTPNFKEKGISLLKQAAERGCVAAFLYLNDIAKGSSIGKAAVASVCGLGDGDPTMEILQWGSGLFGNGRLGEVFERHLAVNDEMQQYHVIL